MINKLTDEELEQVVAGTSIGGHIDAKVQVMAETPNDYETCPYCMCQRCGTRQTVRITYTDTDIGMKLWTESRVRWICGTCGMERPY